MAALVTTDELLRYLQADDEARGEVEQARAAAVERLRRATDIDWCTRPDCETASEAVRVMVYLSYYAVRDAAKNTEFLQSYQTRLIKALQNSVAPEEVLLDGG